MRKLAYLALCGALLAPGLALAQNDAPNSPPPPGPDGGPPPPPPGAWGGKHHGHGGPGDDWMQGPEFLNQFYAANTTHDGHLTLAQAKAANMKPVVDHFNAIDTKHKGYVTFYDIEAWKLDQTAQRLEQRADQLRAQD